MEVIELQQVESTNTYAKNNLEVLKDRTIVHALRQSAGRGRLNRTWVDLGAENLFMSIVLKPSDTFKEVYPNITQYLSVALCRVLEGYGVKPQIKWPNDVLIDGKKIAGILSETVISGRTLKGIIVGIGVNLNSNQKDLDAIPNKIATSLNLETNKKIDLKIFRDKLLNEFFINYDKFIENGFCEILDEYINRNCFLKKELNVQIFNKLENGFAEAITDKGELVLKTKDDKELVLTIGDIL